MQAAIDAEHAQADVHNHGEPSTEPLARVTDSGARGKQVAKRPPSPTGMGPDTDALPAQVARPERDAKPPRAEESLRAAKALRAAEELRVAEAARARVAEPAPPAAEPVPAPAPEPAPPAEPTSQAEPARAAAPSQAPRSAVAAAFEDQRAPASIGWLWPENNAPGGSGPQWKPPSRWSLADRWRYRTATLVALGAVLLAGAGLVIGLALRSAPAGTAAQAGSGANPSAQSTTSPRHGHGTKPSSGAAAGGSGAPSKPPAKSQQANPVNPALAPDRAAAAAWVTQQVAPGTAVACDAQACAALTNNGFASPLVQVGPTSQSLSNAELVVVTPELRAAFTATNTSLGADVAPTLLGSWGSGTAQVTVQVVYPAGAAAYQTALGQAVQKQMTVGQQLLNTGKLSASAAVQSDLTAGAVDQRLLLVIKALAGKQPIDIVGFADSGPNASAGVPFRLLDLAETDPAAGASGQAYLSSMLSLLKAHATFPAFNHVGSVTLPNGQTVIQVEYAAPSPLG